MPPLIDIITHESTYSYTLCIYEYECSQQQTNNSAQNFFKRWGQIDASVILSEWRFADHFGKFNFENFGKSMTKPPENVYYIMCSLSPSPPSNTVYTHYNSSVLSAILRACSQRCRIIAKHTSPTNVKWSLYFVYVVINTTDVQMSV